MRHRSAIEARDFNSRSMATWGLVANGSASLPYLERMLKSTDADTREDAAGIYGAIATGEPRIIDELIAAADHEPNVQALDSIVLALGEFRDKRAVPILARHFRDPSLDGDSHSLVVVSLGKIARRRFDRQPDPDAAAEAWLDRQHE